MRFASDTGGTFTDLIVEDDDGNVSLFKAATVPEDPVQGVIAALQIAARSFGYEVDELLSRGDTFIHGTTHAINAIITGNTARTAFLTTAGHPDILFMREGGRADLFNNTQPFPQPYIPRAATFEIPERIDARGNIIVPIDKRVVADILGQISSQQFDAIAVCLLWSIVNPAHELALEELIEDTMPSVAYTLSHRLNPTPREYRRASSTAIDASLKPLMTHYLSSLTGRLQEAGFSGRVLMLTSGGGMLDAGDVAAAPIHSLNSGPSMAPLAGRHYANQTGKNRDIIVADTGGTTYDVSLVRDGRIPMSRDVWIGPAYLGHMTGFPSIDVKSVGAGGGSIAYVDDGNLLHVGPQSAGSRPGPVCYGRGGRSPTVTDASVVLGHLDEQYFLGGSMRLDVASAKDAVQRLLADPLGLTVEEAASSVLELATENMAQAIIDITVKQGIDAESAILVGGGGAAGLNSAWIARRLGCHQLVIPETGAALSAAGALMSDLSAEYSSTRYTKSDTFDLTSVAQVLGELGAQCTRFIEGPGQDAVSHTITYSAQARYQNQVWEIELPLPINTIDSQADVDLLTEEFHRQHESIFGIRDTFSAVEFVSWTAAVACRLRQGPNLRMRRCADAQANDRRRAYFPETGWQDADVLRLGNIEPGTGGAGPAIVESPFTTIVIPPGSDFRLDDNGNFIISAEKVDAT